MNDPDASTEAERLSLRAGNRLAETQSDRHGQVPEEDRGAAIQAKALEILRREFPPPSQVQSPTCEVQSRKGEVQSPTSNVQSPESASQIVRVEPTGSLRAPHSALPTQILPARMLNEFVYCSRLFYYEFVESVFVESGDTLRGKALHRRVDAGKGDLPPAAGKEGGRRKKEDGGGQKTEDGIAAAAAPSTLNSQPSTDEVIHSRSVQMGSERLGVTAKMDLIEVRIGSMPVEPGQTGDLFATTEVSPAPEEASPTLSRITHHASRITFPRRLPGGLQGWRA